MNPTEKIVIQKVINNLENSTRVNWISGDLQKWADWGNQMKRTILDSTAILDGILGVPSEPEEKKKSEKTTKDLLGG